MDSSELEQLLLEFIVLPSETEWIEFKEAKDNYDFEDIGRYFSAISNEANLHNRQSGWLIFGISDKRPRQIIGTQYRKTPPGLDKLKFLISQHTNHQITFIQIYELNIQDKRVIMFQIPPAPRGIPTEWKGKMYGRIHDSLENLSVDKLDRIRKQSTRDDWSAHICEQATTADLHPEAISFARTQYKIKNKGTHIEAEVDEWDDITFLNKSKICINGQITRAAIILLGKNESEHFLSPAVGKISWILRDSDGTEIDYHHFGPPFLLAVQQVHSKIRNLTYRYIPNMSLFPTEITKYDPWVIRESLHNCIAHQDYSLGGKITVIEESESLLFSNLGDFIPGTIEKVIHDDSPPEFYRNRFLAEAMVNYNMIDTIGSGIKRIYSKQWKRHFPMPDYDLSERGKVRVRIYGKVIDVTYTQMLIARTDLMLYDVIALDKVQKKEPISEEEYKSLKKKKLVEGKRPNLYVSAEVAAATDTKAEYIRNKSLNKPQHKGLILSYLKTYSSASREDIIKLLRPTLSDVLDEQQKTNFIRNLLQEMKKEGTIQTVGHSRWAKWVLSPPHTEG